ncbi:MAG: hypothetical protein IJ064_02470 [Bacteroidaceae bacterium]|nr:hypothetical protein [Bacteroidaceae bacterium]
MKRMILFLLAVAVQISVFAQQYFPEGTKWTEIRLDTLKYDTWYSKVGDEWIPNFETVEYYVKGEFVDKDYGTFKCVYANSSEVSDSLALLLYEKGREWEEHKWIEATVPLFYEGHFLVWPGRAYQFDWYAGLVLYCFSIANANTTGIYDTHKFGTIKEINEGYFGGVKPLKYVDLNGVRIIQGIGVTEWNDGECLFGPIEPYMTYMMWKEESMLHYKERNLRSMLVHFERDGEVLYNVWPEKGTSGIGPVYNSEGIANKNYDFSGRHIAKPTRGIYIRNGRKVLVK